MIDDERVLMLSLNFNPLNRVSGFLQPRTRFLAVNLDGLDLTALPEQALNLVQAWKAIFFSFFILESDLSENKINFPIQMSDLSLQPCDSLPVFLYAFNSEN
jgi:hypothetical protein